jgi:hypothetical protein
MFLLSTAQRGYAILKLHRDCLSEVATLIEAEALAFSKGAAEVMSRR